jgi:translation initiation factor 5A
LAEREAYLHGGRPKKPQGIMSSKATFPEEQDHYAAEAAGSANASLTTPAQASALRKGGYVVLKSHPCKILETTTAKPGKHGHAKCQFRGRDIFTSAAVEDMTPSTHNMEVPVVTKTEWHVIHVGSDGWLQLLNKGGLKEDLKCPVGETGEKIRLMLKENRNVVAVVLRAIGEEIVVEVKEGVKD